MLIGLRTPIWFSFCICADDRSVIYKDAFTPKTIKKFTSHFNGTVYGSEIKLRDGKMRFGSEVIENQYIIGTDQGYLGIVGSLLSGISIANRYGLVGN